MQAIVQRTAIVAVVAVFAQIGNKPTDERVTFALPDVNGKLVKNSNFRARYLLLVYQGIP